MGPNLCGSGCEWAICIPLTCHELFMVIQFGLSLYVFLFLEQLLYAEPSVFVDKFCIGYEEVEEAYYFMFLSIIFFVLHVIGSCVYCCLLRVATNDISILQSGQQRINSPPPQSVVQPLNPNSRNNNQRGRGRGREKPRGGRGG